MSKLVFLQGAESICEVNGFKNVDAVTRVGAEQRLSTLSAKDRYCEAGASKIGLRWLDGRYYPKVKFVLLSSKSPFLTTTGCGSALSRAVAIWAAGADEKIASSARGLEKTPLYSC